ncbi:MAG TPA: hypothetical protein VI056_13505 [Candidatus Limnocylindria bacterium]
MRSERALGVAISALNELGYGAERASAAEVEAITVWYDTTSVGDLSRVEAGVIADRIVPPFAKARKLSPGATARVRTAVVDALHDCFISNALASRSSLGAFRLSCERAVEGAVLQIVGPEPAHALATLLNIDMSEEHRGR